MADKGKGAKILKGLHALGTHLSETVENEELYDARVSRTDL